MTSTASMPRDLKANNKKAILNDFLKYGLQSVNNISGHTGISRQTVKKCVEAYVESGQLVYAGKGKSSSIGGKRPELYDINPGLKIACVILHHHDVRIHIVNFKYQILASWVSEEMEFSSLNMIFEQLRKGKKELDKTVNWEEILAVYFSGPMLVNDRGCLLPTAPFANWPKEDLERPFLNDLRDIFDGIECLCTYLDAVAAGAAILRQNEDYQDEKVVLTIYSDTGIGGSVFRNGKTLNKNKNIIGALGHMVIDASDSTVCECGVHGCLENLVNQKRKFMRFQEQEEAYRKSCLGEHAPEEVSFPQLFEGSAAEDAFCRQEVAYYADMFARALQNMLVICDADVIVFQGDFGHADQYFDDVLRKSLLECRFFTEETLPKIRYDNQPLYLQESVGLTYLFLQDYLNQPEKFTAEKAAEKAAAE